MQESQEPGKNKHFCLSILDSRNIICRNSPSFTTPYLTCKKYTILLIWSNYLEQVVQTVVPQVHEILLIHFQMYYIKNTVHIQDFSVQCCRGGNSYKKLFVVDKRYLGLHIIRGGWSKHYDHWCLLARAEAKLDTTLCHTPILTNELGDYPSLNRHLCRLKIHCTETDFTPRKIILHQDSIGQLSAKLWINII